MLDAGLRPDRLDGLAAARQPLGRAGAWRERYRAGKNGENHDCTGCADFLGGKKNDQHHSDDAERPARLAQAPSDRRQPRLGPFLEVAGGHDGRLRRGGRAATRAIYSSESLQ